MALWVAVHGLVDGQDVKADTFNSPLYELAARTNYLYNRLQDLLGSSIYESVRLYDVPLATTGTLAPAVKDIVCLDNATGTFVKAQASMSLLDEFVASNSAFAIGVLISQTGSTGTVLISGRLSLATSDTPWAVADLLESGEEFRNGPYYLSSLEAGKLTATPSGPMIYMGSFLCDENTPANGDYAILNPQHRDTGESHVHRTYKLYAQPAGQQVITEETPDGIHYITGYQSDAQKNDGGSLTDWVPRLVVMGTWTASTTVQYTCWLSTSIGTTQATSLPPADWSDTYLHWISSDPDEGQGKVQIWSFETVATVGTHGMQVVLENPAGSSPFEGSGWDIPYLVYADSVDLRSWTLSMPGAGVGWRANHLRQYFEHTVVNDSKYSMMLIGGPHESDGRTYDSINVKCAEIHEFALELPLDGDTTVIGSQTYEYTDDGTVTAGNTPVMIEGDEVDPTPTYVNLVAAILANNVGDSTDVTPVLDEDELYVLLGTPATTTVTHRGVNVPMTVDGAGDLTIGAGTACFLVHDQYNRNLVVNYGTRYWANAEFWQFVALKNNLQILVIPFDSNGTPATGAAVEVDDLWTAEFNDAAPGAHFVYAMGMHQSLNAYYPPIPAKVATLVLNGVELDSKEFFDDASTYNMAQDSLYWYSNQYGTVPWPIDWVDAETAGESHLAQKLLLHFVRNTIGDSGYVTSVRPGPNSPITVSQCGTRNPATTGDLELNLDLTLAVEDTNLTGYRVVKAADDGKLQRGPVVEKIVPGPGLTITQSSGAPTGQGVVTISLSGGNDVYTGDFEEVALENAKQELIGMFPYVRLLGWTTGGSNTPTGFVAKFRVPHTVLDAYYRVVVYATVFGEENVAYTPDAAAPRAGLTFTFCVLPDVFPIGNDTTLPTNALNLADNLIQPAAAVNVAMPMGDPSKTPYAYKAYDPMLIHNNNTETDVPGQRLQVLGNPFPSVDDVPEWTDDPSRLGVRPGSLVAVRFSRADLADPENEYTGALGFINLRWMLVGV